MRYGTGYDNIDVGSRSTARRNCCGLVIADYCAEEVATACRRALLVACHRQLGALQESVRRCSGNPLEALLPDSATFRSSTVGY